MATATAVAIPSATRFSFVEPSASRGLPLSLDLPAIVAPSQGVAPFVPGKYFRNPTANDATGGGPGKPSAVMVTGPSRPAVSGALPLYRSNLRA